MFYMGEKRLGRAPDDLPIYELAWALHKTPDEIREMPIDDFWWMIIVNQAKFLAFKELKKRNPKNEDDK